MANPIPFKPKAVDPREELQNRLAAAPVKHAEALLVGYDLLQSAHENGMLDLLNGIVSGRDVIAAKLAEYAKLPEGTAAIRNLLELAKVLTALDPETLDHVTRAMVSASQAHRAEVAPPSLWALAKRATSADSRRGLSLMTLMLGAMGKALGGPKSGGH